jgi:hypothetical protein
MFSPNVVTRDFGYVARGRGVMRINYPTVPVGAERLRFTPTPFHTDAMMQRLVEALCQIMPPARSVRIAHHYVDA